MRHPSLGLPPSEGIPCAYTLDRGREGLLERLRGEARTGWRALDLQINARWRSARARRESDVECERRTQLVLSR